MCFFKEGKTDAEKMVVYETHESEQSLRWDFFVELYKFPGYGSFADLVFEARSGSKAEAVAGDGLVGKS